MTITAGHAHEGIGDRDHSGHSSRRGSLTMDHITTPTPSPHGHAPDYASAPSEPGDTTSTGGAVHHHLPQLPPKHQHQGGNGHNHHHHFTPEHQQHQQQPHPSSYKTHPSQDHPAYSQGQYSGSQHTHNTPSPPLPSPADGFHAQDPSNPSHQSYRSDSRRGSITDPDYHGSAMAVDRRPSNAGTIDGSPGYYGPNTPASIAERRHYAASSPSSTPSSATSEPHPHHQHHGPYAPHAHPSTSPMQLRQSEQYAGGRRESLPSIHSSAGPLGQLLAQEPQRRHSIAHADPMGPLKRKISTPLSQMHSSSTAEHPAKRRDSIPDAAHPHHHGHHGHHPHHHHPYPPRSSFSAPSSPPRRGSLAPPPPVPTLNLQPAAEIKSSPNHHGGPAPSSSGYGSSNGNSGMSSSSISHINGNMDHVRPHFTQHQPRRPSLLSDASLSRRSSVADVSSQHYPPAHYQSSSSSSSLQQQQDYDNNMNIDLQNMNLTGAQQHNGSEGGHGYGGSNPAAPAGSIGSNGSMSHAHHLYPGYPSYADGGSQKGDTPYSRSPELRVSHKLAERKRRKEMKELFDELRDSLPVDRSLKTSKWEILSKAVDFISSMKNSHDEMAKEVDMLRQELSRLQKR
ncbi:hypothetical protein EMPS_08493 [Entomortierella parvispora]|uniref:BHLH domain-containing protein n=1 Tax=Entomortierella parvispora TaxID=205924 RepID=A0A9P3LZC3_9FUNG|nr:hypothetical protein EMPS_08493 [Entomortierella parvispora]